MADRGGYRGRGGGRGGRGGGGGGGHHHPRGGRGGGAGGGTDAHGERPKKENILDLKKYMDQRIMVKFNGGREGRFLARLSIPTPREMLLPLGGQLP